MQTPNNDQALPSVLHNALCVSYIPGVMFDPHLHRVHTFVHNCEDVGFFLDLNRFAQAALGPESYRPSAALLDVVYLWADHLSQSRGSYPSLLPRALQSTANALSTSHPRKIIESIQAEVLLSYYFLRNARVVEGRHHVSAALALTISAGLQHYGNSNSPSHSGSMGPPTDSVDHGERILAFWIVLGLNNCWNGGDDDDGISSSVSYTPGEGPRIDAPWPLTIAEYAQVSPPFSFTCLGLTSLIRVHQLTIMDERIRCRDFSATHLEMIMVVAYQLFMRRRLSYSVKQV